MRRQTNRTGVSLLEVLVAIFIVAIGLLALLTLFPLGALRMGQALKDDRTSQLAQSADGYLRAHWRNSVVAEFKKLNDSDPTNPGNPDPFVWAMDDPNLLLKMKSKPGDPTHKGPPYWENHYPPALFSRPPGVTIPQAPPAFVSPLTLVSDVWVGAGNEAPALTPALLADPTGHGHYVTAGIPTPGVASYPVLVDPLGYLARQNYPDQRWVGGPDLTSGFIPIPRRTLATTTAPYVNPYPPPGLLGRTQAMETFCLTDDFTFRLNGGAGDPTTGQPVRQGRYSCAAMVQRLDNAVRDTASLKVLVFDARPPGLATPDDEVVLHGVTAAQGFQPGSRAVTLSVKTRGPDQTPLIRKGGWILDGTIDPNAGVRNANFYRVVGVTESPDPAKAANTLYALDLEKEIVAGPVSPGGTTVYLFAGLAEVFERPMLVPDQN